MNQGAGKWPWEVRFFSLALLTRAVEIGLVLVPQLSVCFVGLTFFPSTYWRMPKISRAFVHGNTFLHSWSGLIKLVICLLHGATFLSNLTSPPFVPVRGLGHQDNTLSPSRSLCQLRTLSEPYASF